MGRAKKRRRSEEDSDEDELDSKFLCEDSDDDSLSSEGCGDDGVGPSALEREWDCAAKVLEAARLSGVEILPSFLHNRKAAGDVGEILLSDPSLLKTPQEMEKVVQARGKKAKALLALPMLSWVGENGLAGRPPKEGEAELHLRLLFVDFRGSWKRGVKSSPASAWIYDPLQGSRKQQLPNLYSALRKVKNTRLNLTPRPKVITGDDPVGSNDCVGQCCRYVRALASRAVPKTAQSLVNLLDDPLFKP